MTSGEGSPRTRRPPTVVVGGLPRWWCLALSRDLAAADAELRERLLEELGRLLLGATLLHVGEVRLVRLRLLHSWRVLLVATRGQTARRRVDHDRDLLRRQVRREVPDRLVAERVPVRHRDTVRVEAVVLLTHGSRAHAGAADCAASRCHLLPLGCVTRRQAPENFVIRPSTTMQATQTRPRITVIRLRLRSATPEAPRFEVTPPPNMSERPPPRPRCSRIIMV